MSFRASCMQHHTEPHSDGGSQSMHATTGLLQSASEANLVVPRVKCIIDSGQSAFYSLSHAGHFATSLFATRNEYISAPVQYVSENYSGPIRRLAAATSCASWSCRSQVQALRNSVASTNVHLTLRTAAITSCDGVARRVVGCAKPSLAVRVHFKSAERNPKALVNTFARVCR